MIILTATYIIYETACLPPNTNLMHDLISIALEMGGSISNTKRAAGPLIESFGGGEGRLLDRSRFKQNLLEARLRVQLEKTRMLFNGAENIFGVQLGVGALNHFYIEIMVVNNDPIFITIWFGDQEIGSISWARAHVDNTNSNTLVEFLHRGAGNL